MISTFSYHDQTKRAGDIKIAPPSKKCSKLSRRWSRIRAYHAKNKIGKEMTFIWPQTKEPSVVVQLVCTYLRQTITDSILHVSQLENKPDC
jgi:hypothetical protein